MASAYEEALMGIIGSMLGGFDFSDPNSMYNVDTKGAGDPIAAQRAGLYFNTDASYAGKNYTADSYVDETDPFAVEAAKGFVVTKPYSYFIGSTRYDVSPGTYISPSDSRYSSVNTGGAYSQYVQPVATTKNAGDIIGYGKISSGSPTAAYREFQSYLDTLKQRETAAQANDPMNDIVGRMNSEYTKGQNYNDQFLSTLQGLPSQYQSRQTDIMGMLDNYGAQQSADITSQFNQQRAATSQDLMSRGLGNSTVQSSAMQGLTSAESAEQRRLGESLISRKVDTQSQLSGDYLNSLASLASGYQASSKNYPSLIDIGNIALQYGRAASDRESIPVRSLLGS